MNDNGPNDAEEIRTRRSVLAAAGGLLLPTGLMGAGAEGAEATRKTRRRRRGKPGMIANDTIINFRNATSKTLDFHMNSVVTYTSLEPGKESGFAAGVAPWKFMTEATLFILVPGLNEQFNVLCRNLEIMTPFARLSSSIEGKIIQESMAENESFEVISRSYRFNVHRWSNGKEALDGYDEWYTRFFVTMSDA